MVKAEFRPLKKQEGYTLQIQYTQEGTIERKKYLHSVYAPSEEAQKWAEEVFDPGVWIYVIYGIGFLYHIEALMSRLEEERSKKMQKREFVPNIKLILLEPFGEVIQAVRQTAKWEAVMEKENIIFIESFDEVSLRKEFNSALTQNEIDHLEIKFWTSYRGMDPVAEKMLMKTIRNVKMRRLLSSNTLNLFQDSMPTNLVKNAKYILRSTKIQDIENLFLYHTAVVVSAGPSLEKNIEQLKDFQNRVLIISGGRSVKALISRGIKPHFICSLDPDEENYRLYQEMGILSLNIPMISSWGNNHRIVEEYSGKKVFVNNSGLKSLDKQFFGEKLTTIATGFTVATMQMSVAMALGCDKIIFIGQDMAYGEEGERYGRDTKRKFGDDVDGDNFYYVRGNLCEKVKTSYDLDLFRQHFEEQISKMEYCTFINATEGGAYVQGTRVMSLQDALKEYAGKEEDFTWIIDEHLKVVEASEKIKMLKDNLKRCIEDARKLERYGREGLMWAMKITMDFEKNKGVLRKLEKIDQKIETVKESTELSNYFIQQELAYVGGTTEDELDNKEIIDQTRLLYRSIRSAGMKMANLLEEELKVLDEF